MISPPSAQRAPTRPPIPHPRFLPLLIAIAALAALAAPAHAVSFSVLNYPSLVTSIPYTRDVCVATSGDLATLGVAVLSSFTWTSASTSVFSYQLDVAPLLSSYGISCDAATVSVDDTSTTSQDSFALSNPARQGYPAEKWDVRCSSSATITSLNFYFAASEALVDQLYSNKITGNYFDYQISASTSTISCAHSTSIWPFPSLFLNYSLIFSTKKPFVPNKCPLTIPFSLNTVYNHFNYSIAVPGTPFSLKFTSFPIDFDVPDMIPGRSCLSLKITMWMGALSKSMTIDNPTSSGYPADSPFEIDCYDGQATNSKTFLKVFTTYNYTTVANAISTYNCSAPGAYFEYDYQLADSLQRYTCVYYDSSLPPPQDCAKFPYQVTLKELPGQCPSGTQNPEDCPASLPMQLATLTKGYYWTSTGVLSYGIDALAVLNTAFDMGCTSATFAVDDISPTSTIGLYRITDKNQANYPPTQLPWLISCRSGATIANLSLGFNLSATQANNLYGCPFAGDYAYVTVMLSTTQILSCLYRGEPAPTPSPSRSPSPTPTRSPSWSPSPVVTPSRSPSPSPVVTQSPSLSASPVVTPSRSPSPSPVITSSPVVTASRSPLSSPIITPSPVVTPSHSPSPSPFVTPSPVVTPSPSPLRTPSPSPTPLRTASPSPTPLRTLTSSPAPPAPTSSPVPPTPAPTPNPAESTAPPTPSPSPEPAAPRSSSTCFPGEAIVELDNGRFITMDKLKVGDRVRVSPTEFSQVYLFGHRISSRLETYVEISTSSSKLAASPVHIVYAATGAKAAANIQVGDKLVDSTGKYRHVVAVKLVRLRGVYNPHTLHGDIVVNGFKASSYTSQIPPPVAHMLLGPVRVIYRLFGFNILGRWLEEDHTRAADFAKRYLMQH